jgi:hypothetical protein
MRWILGVAAIAIVVGVVATITVPAQTITPDEATLKLFPPETEGIGFVDVAGLRGAPLFNELILQKLPSFPREMREFVDATGFQIERDVDRITAGHINSREVLVIVQARYDRFKVEQFVVDKADDLTTETYLGRQIYKGNDTSDHAGGVAFIDNLIVAGNLNAVKQAIDRLAAPAPSVVQNTELMNKIRTIESGNQIWAAGKFDLSKLGTDANAPARIGEMVHSLKAGTYQMRIDQDVHLKATGSFGSDDMAKATSDMLRGLLAVAKLQVSQEEKLVRLLEGLSIEYSGDTLVVSFSATGDLLKQIHEMRGIRALAK